jgi:hypothetical protein
MTPIGRGVTLNGNLNKEKGRMEWVKLAHDLVNGWTVVNTIMNLRLKQGREILRQLSDYQLLKTDNVL